MEVPSAGVPFNTTKADQKLAAFLSSCLSESSIPCVLWGNYLLTVYGVPSVVNSIDFVVPDESIEAAARAVSSRGLSRCTNIKSCATVAENRFSPPPLAHFHFGSVVTVGLYPKSSTLAFLPSLELSLECENMPPDIILASDPRLPTPRPGRGFGAFHPASTPVCIPSAHRLTEAFTRQLATARRDSYEYFARAMLTYIEEYVDGDGLLDTSLLEPRTRDFYLGLKNHTKPVAELLEDVKSAFSQAAI